MARRLAGSNAPEPRRPAAQPQAAPPQQYDEWWRVFDDPALDQVVAEAQRSNPSVAIAGARIMEARAQLGVAGSGLYPQLQQVSGHAFGVGQNASDAPDHSFGSYGAAFDIAWEMDFWGKYRRGIEAADANYFASIAQYDDVQVLVAAQAASLYTSIRTFEQRLHIAQENAALQKRSLEITERLFTSGNESELDVQQAKSLYLGTIATIPELESAPAPGAERAERAARPAAGAGAGDGGGREQIPEAGLDVIVDMPADLLRRRPDVRTAEMQLAAQSALIGVSAGGAVSLDRAGRDGRALGTSLDVVVDHAHLERRARARVERVRLRPAAEPGAGAGRALPATVRGRTRTPCCGPPAKWTMPRCRSPRAGSRSSILEQAVQAAKRSLDIATIQYQEGLVDFERVLDSQRTLFSQQERLVTTRGSVTQSLISLYKAMGGGWQAGRSRPVLDRDAAAQSHGGAQ